MSQQGRSAQARQLGIVGEELRDPVGCLLVAREKRADLRRERALPRQPRAQLGFAGGRGRVHQAQQRMVLGRIELQRRGGEQQQPPGAAGERLGHLVGPRPAQMVGLVDHDQVPARLGGRLRFRAAAGEELQRGDHQRVPRPGRAFRLVGLGLRRLAIVAGAVRVHQGEEQVELVEQLRQPLHGQMRRRHHQGALHQACVQQRGEHQARLDGLAQPHLVGEHEARLRRREHLVRHRDLVRLHVDARGEERPQGVRAAQQIEAHRLGAEEKILRRAPAAGGELLGRALPRRRRAQVALAAEGRLLSLDLDGVAVEVGGRAGKRAQHSRSGAVGKDGG